MEEDDKNSPPDWYLMMGEERLGEVWLDDVDQPWYHCTFKAYPAFEKIRQKIESANERSKQAFKSEQYELLSRINNEIYALGLCLIWESGQKEPRPDMEGSVSFNTNGKIAFRPLHIRLVGGNPVPFRRLD